MAIKITENSVVNYENEPNVDRELFPNLNETGYLPEDYQQLIRDVDTLKSDVTTINGEITEIQGDITTAENNIEDLDDEIGALKNDLNQFPNGNYPQMGAGYANQLVSGLKKEDQTPYNFRKVPYDATLEEVKKIVGVSVPWNQLVDKDKFLPSQTLSGIPYTNNGDGSITLQVTEVPSATISIAVTANHSASYVHVPYNHKFIVYDRHSKPSGIEYRNSFNGHSLEWNSVKNQAQTNGYLLLGMNINTEAIVGTYTLEPQITDLTQEFGTAIADYVYSLETATAGAGVAWLKKHFPAQFDAGYQAYDAGTLKSIGGLVAKKTVGFNQWDEQWELGSFNGGNGQKATNSDKIRSKNYIPVLPNTVYYFQHTAVAVGGADVFMYDSNKTYLGYVNYGVHEAKQITTPSNACFMMFTILGTTYNHDICINFSDPTKNGTYEPYEAHSYALDSDVVLRGVPKVDSNGNLYYDGDEYLPDGTVNRRWGIVDLGTLTWEKAPTVTRYRARIVGMVSTTYPNRITNFTLSNGKYTKVTTDDSVDATMLCDNGWIAIYDTAYETASDFKAAMSNVYLLYPLAAPTTETADPYTTPQFISPDGTEEYIYEDGAFELPVGHSSDYPVNVSGQLDDILDTPSANGTYTLKATVTDGEVTYSWVADA